MICNHNHDHDFIHCDINDQKNTENILTVYATLAAMTVASVLSVLKFWGAQVSCSHAVQCTAHDSLMDIGISFMNFAAIMVMRNNYMKSKFNVLKIGAIVTLVQAVIILYLSYFLIGESWIRLINDQNCLHDLYHPIIGSIIGLILNLFLVLFQQYVINKTDSSIIRADKIHFQSDFFMNGAVLFGIIGIKYFDVYWVDSALGFACSIYLIASIIPLAHRSIKILTNNKSK